MLDCTDGHLKNVEQPIKDINGRRWARRKWQWSATQRALLAYELECGAAYAHRLTRRQAAGFAEANIVYVAAIAHATDGERAALKHGKLTISQLHNNKARPTQKTGRSFLAILAATWNAANSDERLAFGRAIGVERVWSGPVALGGRNGNSELVSR